MQRERFKAVQKFVEIIEHPRLDPEHRTLVGMKGRVIAHYVASRSSRVYLTDSTETVVPDEALRPLPKRR